MRSRVPTIFILILVFLALFNPVTAQDTTFTIQTIRFENMPAYDIKVAPDGRTAAVYAGTTSLSLLNMPNIEYTVAPSLLPILLIDLTTGNEIAQLTGPTDYITDVAFTPDSRGLASYHRNGEIYLWDTASGQLIRKLTVLMGMAKLEFLPDGKTLVAYMADSMTGYFLLWDVETGYMTRVWRESYTAFGDLQISRSPGNLDYRYAAFDISPDGTLLATATPNGELVVWDTTTLEQTVVQPKAEREGMFNIRSVTFSPDSQTLIYYDSIAEQTIFWDVASHSEMVTVPGGYIYFGVSPNRDALVWATRTELWFARPDQPDNATKVLDFPGDLLVAWPTVTFTSDNSVVVGGFGMRAGGENPVYGENLLYIITFN